MWNERYAGAEFAYGTAPNDFLVEWHTALPPAGRVLCLAEGEGRNAVWLAERGFAVSAVDLSEVGLAKAQRLAAERGVTITTHHADLAEFVIEPGAWDAIVSIFCHLPAPLRRDLHARVVAGLRPGGVLLLEAYTPAQLHYQSGGPPVAEMMMEAEGLRAEFAALEPIHLVECEREVHEGRYHQGLGAVVQLLARRV